MAPLPVPRDVAFELLDREILFVDDSLHQIADGDNADDLVIYEHREVADPLLSHECHAFFDGLLWPYPDHIMGHDLLDRSV